MPAYYDNKYNYWYSKFYYTDVTGVLRQKMKRGFTTQYDAQKYEVMFKEYGEAHLNILFIDFYKLYYNDISKRIKLSTLITKDKIFELHILPYFGNMYMDKIKPVDIRNWQTTLLSKNYSNAYLRGINVQLTALFNFAVTFYGLSTNPCKQAGCIIKPEKKEMKFWTSHEYSSFISSFNRGTLAHTVFETLYWTGIREGELLALTLNDINFEKSHLTINKTLHKIQGKNLITSPKTPRSNRIVPIPFFLCDELSEYISINNIKKPYEQIFNCRRTLLYEEMKRGCSISGIKKIRIHDLRHSHASLLINLGFPPAVIAERLGHERISTTLNTYSHFFPNQQASLVKALEDLGKPKNNKSDIIVTETNDNNAQ